jgi:hypothetical protein
VENDQFFLKRAASFVALKPSLCSQNDLKIEGSIVSECTLKGIILSSLLGYSSYFSCLFF